MTQPPNPSRPAMTEAEREAMVADDDRCADCGFLACICFDDDEIGAPDDDDLDECGMMPDSFCMLAGTEYCDWDCPRNRPARANQGTPS